MMQPEAVKLPDVQVMDLKMELDEQDRPTIQLFEHGFVTIHDHMGEDLTPVNAAKVSFAAHAEHYGPDEHGLNNFLMREHHGSPYEHTAITLVMRAPLFVLYEHHRHRAGHSYNEESGRYSILRNDFHTYEPDELTTQVGKPGHYQYIPLIDALAPDDRWIANEASEIIEQTQRFAFREYYRLLEMGVAKQQARVVLPVGMFKEQWWTCNLRSLMHFLSLRMDKNAQQEIRAYANAAYLLAEHLWPNTMSLFAERGFVAP